MHKFGLISKIRTIIFTEKFSKWVWKHETEQDYAWLQDNWCEFWDGYAELLNDIQMILDPKDEAEACSRWCNFDICRTYYYWMKERHGSNADLVADVLYLLWMTPQEA